MLFVTIAVSLVTTAFATCTVSDNDACLQNTPTWDTAYTCANSAAYCDGWSKDMHRCCPDTCGTGALSENECLALSSFGTCIYPNDAQCTPAEACPSRCKTCADGGVTPYVCYEFCSQWGHCGSTSDHQIGGTDCSGCDGSCPSQCSSCQADMPLVDGVCTHHCSQYNYCGDTETHSIGGTDCSSCTQATTTTQKPSYCDGEGDPCYKQIYCQNTCSVNPSQCGLCYSGPVETHYCPSGATADCTIEVAYGEVDFVESGECANYEMHAEACASAGGNYMLIEASMEVCVGGSSGMESCTTTHQETSTSVAHTISYSPGKKLCLTNFGAYCGQVSTGFKGHSRIDIVDGESTPCPGQAQIQGWMSCDLSSISTPTTTTAAGATNAPTSGAKEVCISAALLFLPFVM